MNTRADYAVILDFEATCDDKKQPNPQEIIEFPSVILSLETVETVDEFEAFVKPYHHPDLSEFCKSFTSISQNDVDSALSFQEVFKNHFKWLKKNEITENNSVFVTCGDWDLNVMLPSQCITAEVELIPAIYVKWHNIKRSFCKVQNRKKAPGMAGMLKDLGLELTGHHHRGIDDCRNISEICKELVRKGAEIDSNAALSINKYPPVTLKLKLADKIEKIKLTKRTINGLNKMAGKTFRKRISELYNKEGKQLVCDNDLMFLESGELIELKE
ncbi:MAG: exonuclease domain-containing protein [Desulfobacterales bacterium]|nr:exonuclease domain-containing protein [Desulfobacterales bacterium]MCP4161672.1 exonuclease domain-containing protein [Deltaproteobacteria bacterium]